MVRNTIQTLKDRLENMKTWIGIEGNGRGRSKYGKLCLQIVHMLQAEGTLNMMQAAVHLSLGTLMTDALEVWDRTGAYSAGSGKANNNVCTTRKYLGDV